MKLVDKQFTGSLQSQVNTVERRHSPKVDYYCQLRDWVQHVILEAERNKDFEKRDRFLSLLEDLQMPRLSVGA